MDAKHIKVALDASWERLQARERELDEARRAAKATHDALNASVRAHREAHEEYRRMKARFDAAGLEPVH